MSYDEDEPIGLGEKLANLFFNFLDGAGTVVRKIVWPIEALFGLITDFFSRRLDREYDEDSKLSKIRRVIFRPFAMLAIGVAWLLGKLNLDGVFARIGRGVAWISRPITYPAVAALNFLSAFYYSRSQRLFWFAIPMICLIGGLGYLVFRVQKQDQFQIQRRYTKALDTAIDGHDFQTATLYRQKLKQLGATVDQFDLQQAEQMLKRGAVKEAFATVERLAPTDGQGLPSAHFWLAIHLLGQAEYDQSKLDSSATQRAEQAIAHLDQLSKAGFENAETSILRAIALTSLQKKLEAQKTLETFARTSLPVAMVRFKLDVQLQDDDSAKDDAATISKLISKDRTFTDRADSEALQLWFTVERVQQRFTQAFAVAERWYKKYPNDRSAAAAVAMTRLDRFDRRWLAAPSSEYAELLALLISACELLPPEESGAVLKRVALLEESSKATLKSKELYDLLTEQEKLPPAINYQLGTAEAAKRNFVKARQHLEAALDWAPEDQTAWNNYAYVIDQGFPKERDLALKAVNRAIELQPKDWHARDTRADILMHLNQNMEAIVDLEFVTKSTDEVDTAVRMNQARAALQNK